MAGDLKKNAEFGGKHKDSEDPILTAQRYLNIYRQIHIFNETRQEEFDDSLMEMPADIRILLSTLPGGSLLLNHIAEVEEKRGIIDSRLKEAAKAKNTKKLNQKRLDDYKRSPADGSSASVLDIIEQSENRHQQDIQALTDALVQSQNNMANVLKDLFKGKSSLKKSDEIIQDTDEDFDDDEEDDIEEDEIEEVKKPSKKSKSKSKHNKKFSKPKPEPHIEIEDENDEEDDDEVQDDDERENTKPAEDATDNTEASKLMSLTRRLFHSIKERRSNRTMLNNDESIDAFGDNTPVSLDDIDDAPVSLDGDSETMPVSQPATASSDEDQDWDWEYVEDDNSDSDGEWEYVEIPEDEAQVEPTNQVEAATPEEPAAKPAPEQAPVAEDNAASMPLTEDVLMPQETQDDLSSYDMQGYEMPQQWADDGGEQMVYYPQDSEMAYDEQYLQDDQNQMWYDPSMADQTDQTAGVETYDNTADLTTADTSSYEEPAPASMPEEEPAPAPMSDEEAPVEVESSASLLKRFMAAEVPNETQEDLTGLDTPESSDTTQVDASEVSDAGDDSNQDAPQNSTDTQQG